MHRSSFAIKCLAVALALPIASIAAADVQFLGSVSTGMAGAGLALPMLAYTEHANPALFGYLPRHFTFMEPNIQVYTRGVSISDIQNNISNPSNGGGSNSSAAKLAQQFGNKVIQLGVGADIGFGFSGFVVGASGGVIVQGNPNAALIADTNSGALSTAITSQNPGGLNPNDQYDAYGFGYYSLDFAYGMKIPYSKKDSDPTIAAGLRVRVVKSYYTHQVLGASQIVNNAGAGQINNPDLNAFENDNLTNSLTDVSVNTASGVGADLGFQTAFGPTKNYYGAFQIRNLVQPNVGFNATNPGQAGNSGLSSAASLNFSQVNPFVTMFDLGAGATLASTKLNLALDFVDIGNKGNSQEVRFGADYDIVKGISVQAGVSSLNGLSLGVSLLGFNFAFSNRIPFSLSTAFRF